jgi:DNA-binding CsgD family transcriptional regulator
MATEPSARVAVNRSRFFKVAVPEAVPEFLDATRLLFGLQRSHQIAQSFAGCLEPQTIARRATDGLVEAFDCALARIWLVEADRTMLKLVASSGMYTRIDGSFARVPMGAFKVGKIAQNRIPFLSNNLAEESWVKDRDWAIANGIFGFAGYPLMIAEQAIGVLAVFSCQPMAPEFLEVLQGLCTTITVALETALRYQQEKQTWQTTAIATPQPIPLSEQLDQILAQARLMLVGTERSLSTALSAVLLRTTELLNELQCSYCRLTYGLETVSLEAMVPAAWGERSSEMPSIPSLRELEFAVACLGGTLQTHAGSNPKMRQILLRLPYVDRPSGLSLRIQCQSPVLQLAFTHLACLAGLDISGTADDTIPLLTDSETLIQSARRVLWVAHCPQPPSKSVSAKIPLSITPTELREALETVMRGKVWHLSSASADERQGLSDREQEIMTLLAQGLRDRDIAHQLYISERTVKFHINNVLIKLRAKTRFQAIYHATRSGWIGIPAQNSTVE